MDFNSHLHNLRNKPPHIRQHIAFWSALGLTAIIFVFWSASFSLSKPSPSVVISKALAQPNPPLESMLAAVGSLYDSVRDRIFSPKKIEFSTVEVGPGSR